jgi:hypothetical protein
MIGYPNIRLIFVMNLKLISNEIRITKSVLHTQ